LDGSGKLFFGAGLFSWFALESIITYRLHLGDELAPALRPTLGIQLAPPVVGATAYLAVTAADLAFYAMFGYGVLQLLFLARLAPWFSSPARPGILGLQLRHHRARVVVHARGDPCAGFVVRESCVAAVHLRQCCNRRADRADAWLLWQGRLFRRLA
jgi:tellurite resistance protein